MTGGTTGTGVPGSTGGMPAGGTFGADGNPIDPNAVIDASKKDDGCGCRVPGGSPKRDTRGTGAALFAVLAGLFLTRRRRRR